MRFRHLAVLALFLAALAAGVSAQESGDSVDTVILASTENYPDALVGAAAASKIGSPVLLTDRDSVPQETQDTLDRLDPSEVVVIGGPAVVSEQVASSLKQDYNVTRLWGTTRYGSAVEVAEHFWVEGNDEAVLVQNGLEERNGTVLAAAKGLAREGEDPIYLTPEGSVPAVVLSSLENLEVEEVTVIGTQVSEGYRSSLNDIGVSIDEEITGENDREIQERVRNRTLQDINSSEELLAVASSGFRHQIAAANFPNTNTFLVTSQDDIDELVSLVNDENVSSVKVAGRPGLAEDAAEALREQTEADVRLVVAQAAEAVRMNANLTEDNIPAFARAHRRQAQQWEDRRQQFADRVKDRANASIQKAQNLVDENASEEAQEALREAETLFSAGDYVEARESALEAIGEVRATRYRSDLDDYAKIQERIQEETSDLQERTQELSEMNQEFGEEMRENMTVEERLETIEEFRNERRETVQDLMEEARDSQGDINKRLRQAREDVRERQRERTASQRFESEIECTDEQVTDLTIEGKDGRVHVEGTVGLSTPNYRPSNSVNVDNENNQVDVTISFAGRRGFGVQCVANAEVEQRVYVASGNWTVDLTVNVDGQEEEFDERKVYVAPDDDGADDESVEDEVEDETEQEINDNGGGSQQVSCSQVDGDTHTVTYSSSGFSPSEITIQRCDTVRWESEGADMWVASAVHPTHTQYDGTGLNQHCPGGGAFDQCESGSTYSFTFENTGEWGYHNNVLAGHTGSVVVQER